MKVLLEIDDALMAKVRDITCAKTDEEAVFFAAQHMSRSARFEEALKDGPFPSASELREKGLLPTPKLKPLKTLAEAV